MKLLLCTKCHDVIQFGAKNTWRSCECSASKARYLEDNWHAEISGEDAYCIGMLNKSVHRAIYDHPKNTDIVAFSFPEPHDRLKRS